MYLSLFISGWGHEGKTPIMVSCQLFVWRWYCVLPLIWASVHVYWRIIFLWLKMPLWQLLWTGLVHDKRTHVRRQGHTAGVMQFGDPMLSKMEEQYWMCKSHKCNGDICYNTLVSSSIFYEYTLLRHACDRKFDLSNLKWILMPYMLSDRQTFWVQSQTLRIHNSSIPDNDSVHTYVLLRQNRAYWRVQCLTESVHACCTTKHPDSSLYLGFEILPACTVIACLQKHIPFLSMEHASP